MLIGASSASVHPTISAQRSLKTVSPVFTFQGYDPTLGARPLRRAIQRMVEDPLSERLLYKQFRAGEIIIVDAEPDAETGKDEITFRAIEGFEPPPTPELAEAGPAAEG